MVAAPPPPFVEAFRADAPAAAAALVPGDLVVFFDGALVASCRALVELVDGADRADDVRLTVMRDGELHELVLRGR